MTQPWTGESLLELCRSYQRSQPLLAAAEVGVFETLAETGKSARQVADALKTDLRATELLLNALSALGVLDKTGDTFSIPRELAPLLTGSDETSVLPMIRHHTTCAHRWDTLARVVHTGRPTFDRASKPRTPTELRAFIKGMHVVGRDVADGVVAGMRPERFRRALDVGGGSGTYTLALLRAVREMSVTLFDLPTVVDMARERMRENDLLDRAELVAGDFYEDPLPGGHDLVLLSAIIHQNSPAQNRALYGKCLDALEPGGSLMIRDILMDDTHTEPPSGALFAINMLVATEGGGTYSYEEIRSDLEAAGFVDVELIERSVWMDSLVSARKPGGQP
jgi:ubiquinone/menaquinone biosynthesis C-methylase UbiE